MESVREVVKKRDGINDKQFDNVLRGWKEELEDTLAEEGDLDELISDWFGLEPDYLYDPELGVF
jgi:hypothetical protein